jgi:DNA-binding CsgD family transcriptional regulator
MGEGQDDRLRAANEAVDAGFAARSIAELDTVMTKAFKRFGMTHFSLDQMRDASGALIGQHQFGKRPSQWGEHYVKEQHYRHDGLVRHAILNPSPMRWRAAQTDRDLSRDERRLFGEAREFGLSDGLVTPVHQIDGCVSAVTVLSGDVLDLSPADEMAVRMLSLYYCSYGCLLRQQGAIVNPKKHSLTPRQRECLQWARAGKSSWDIGQILGISERTVVFHIEQACKRLGVKTRQQAIMEATVHGLISL